MVVVHPLEDEPDPLALLDGEAGAGDPTVEGERDAGQEGHPAGVVANRGEQAAIWDGVHVMPGPGVVEGRLAKQLQLDRAAYALDHAHQVVGHRSRARL